MRYVPSVDLKSWVHRVVGLPARVAGAWDSVAVWDPAVGAVWHVPPGSALDVAAGALAVSV